MNKRHQLTIDQLTEAINSVVEKLEFRVGQKGLGSMASSHEILGILTDELAKFRDEVHQKSGADRKVAELIDVAVAAIFGIASIKSGGVDW